MNPTTPDPNIGLLLGGLVVIWGVALAVITGILFRGYRGRIEKAEALAKGANKAVLRFATCEECGRAVLKEKAKLVKHWSPSIGPSERFYCREHNIQVDEVREGLGWRDYSRRVPCDSKGRVLPYGIEMAPPPPVSILETTVQNMATAVQGHRPHTSNAFTGGEHGEANDRRAATSHVKAHETILGATARREAAGAADQSPGPAPDTQTKAERQDDADHQDR